MDRILNEYGSSDAVNGLFPTARMGCAIAYSDDHANWNVDLLPVDMPAQQNSVSLMLGGMYL